MGPSASASCLANRGNVVLSCAVLHQQTLRQSASFSGVGLHSGNSVSMTFLPAPPNSGHSLSPGGFGGETRDRRAGGVCDDANRSTSLSKGNAKIHTVEHVLAAFAGRGIDNAIVDWIPTSRRLPTAARVNMSK